VRGRLWGGRERRERERERKRKKEREREGGVYIPF